MKQSILIIAVLVAANALFLLFSTEKLRFNNDTTITIAVAAPLTGPDRKQGEAMLNGIRLCLDTVKKQGRLNGVNIEIVTTEDRPERSNALNAALSVLKEDKALLVLGHYYDSSSRAAGAIYQQKKVPAITASASTASITVDNDWYFRVISDSEFNGEFIANYVKEGLGEYATSIISTNDLYGSSLADSYERAAVNAGLEIKNIWKIDLSSRDVEDIIKDIAVQIRGVADPGAIFLSTSPHTGLSVLTNIKYPGTSHTIIGPDSFASPTFLGSLAKHQKEEMLPGYHSDGLYVFTPFQPELFREKGLRFREKYLRRYGDEPAWVAAGYYNAMLVAINAIERVDLEGNNISEDRRRVREALEEINTYDNSIQGVDGAIFFDNEGNANKHMSVSFLNKGKIFPSYKQYYFHPRSEADVSLRGGEENNPVTIKGLTHDEVSVVYTGVDVIFLADLDVAKGSYMMEFYLWFRFQGDFDPTEIQFLNTVVPYQLGEPVVQEVSDGISTIVYRVKTAFKAEFDLHSYPFDQHNLYAAFRHRHLPMEKMIFVPDTLGLPAKTQVSGKTFINYMWNWKVIAVSSKQDAKSLKANDVSEKETFSKFTNIVTIKRLVVGDVAKIAFPFIFLVALTSIIYVLPIDLIVTRFLLIGSVLVLNRLFWARLMTYFSSSLMDRLYYGVWGLAIIAAIFSAITYYYRQGESDGGDRSNFLGRIIHVTAIIIIASWVGTLYR